MEVIKITIISQSTTSIIHGNFSDLPNRVSDALLVIVTVPVILALQLSDTNIILAKLKIWTRRIQMARRLADLRDTELIKDAFPGAATNS